MHSSEMATRVSLCSRNYVENRCAPGERVPALDAACNEWESCMNQQAGIVVKRSKLSAQTLGEVVNAFLEQLSWKSAALLSLLFLVIVVGSNCALSLASNNPIFYPSRQGVGKEKYRESKNRQNSRLSIL